MLASTSSTLVHSLSLSPSLSRPQPTNLARWLPILTLSSNNTSRPRISARDVTFARIIVGTKKVVFTVPEKLLIHYSPFFRVALEGKSRGAAIKEVLLPETDADTFELVVHWLYYQRTRCRCDNEELQKLWSQEDDEGMRKTDNLIKLYVFCDKYDVPLLKRQTMDSLYHHMNDTVLAVALPDDTIVSYAFANLPEDSYLCNFLVDIFCAYAMPGSWSIEKLPASFLTRVLDRFSIDHEGQRKMDGELDACNYRD